MPAGRPKGSKNKPKSNGIDEADAILEADSIKLTPVKEADLAPDDPEEDVEDPGQSQAATEHQNTQNGSETTADTELSPNKVKHVCIMNGLSEIKGQSLTKSCTNKKALEIPVSDILSHYFLHYREQGHWKKIVPPTTEEDRVRIESYQCQLCGQKFRCNREKHDPEPARASFLFHYAVHHGKIIDIIREDPDLDPAKIEGVLRTLQKYSPENREFVTKGTDSTFDSEPYKVQEYCEWQLSQLKAGNLPIPTTNLKPDNKLRCPFRDRDDCKDYDNNKNVGTLKLHLFYHYLPYWENTVPEPSGLEYKCETCTKRMNARTTSALRSTIICHLAIHHNQLKDAIEASEDDFDQELFNKLFNPHLVKKLQILYSDSYTSSKSLPSSTFYSPSASNYSPNFKKAPITEATYDPKAAIDSIVKSFNMKREKPKREKKLTKSKSKKKNHNDSGSDSGSDFDVEAVIPQQPLYRKRIKQNLSNIDFEEDSDKDSDWEEKDKKKKALLDIKASGDRPVRRTAKKLKTYEEDSGSEDH